ncbi:MAG: thioredoxin-disulfide reductase [Nitrospirae bacterium]|nr:MAG: thioredoxin-disulfide reductase [Nitrospirota bacterium]
MKDLIIIGGGPAGLTAGMYAARAKLDTLLLERGIVGGQVLITDWVENYPGFVDGISGPELSQRFEQHALKFGLNIENGSVSGIEREGDVKKILLEDGRSYEAKSVIIATGANPKQLDVEGEDKFRGRGVSYCATCDGAFFKDKKICVVGGGDTAVEEALFLTRFASQVYIIHRRDAFRATKIIQERALSHPKIKVFWDSVVERINGDMVVHSVTLRNVKTNEVFELETDGVFVFIGYIPNTKFLEGFLNLDENGYIIVNEYLETSVPGVFAAGDVTNKFLKQISTAVGDGAVAAVRAEKYIEEQFSQT